MSAEAHWLDGRGAEPQASAPQSPVFPSWMWQSPELGQPSSAAIAPVSQAAWLTDTLLFHYQRCGRRAFLDLYEDGAKRDPASDYLQKLRQDSAGHRREVVNQAPTHYPHYAPHDWSAGAAATLELMQQGVERIAQGVLLGPSLEGFCLVSQPDLLIKQPGQSQFGDWLYVPADVKLGKRPKRDYQITAAFHAFVLATVQEVWPSTSWLVLRESRQYAVNLEEVTPRMYQVLQDCVESLHAADQEPEVFIAHNRCDLCHWFGHCYEQAIAVRHLSLLPGVTPTRYVQLQALQINTLEALASTAPYRLAGLPGFGLPVAQRLVHQAQSVLHNRAIAHVEPDGGIDFLLTPDDLPTAEVELYFDIEASPEQNLVYLHGVLVVDRDRQIETFHPLIAETVDAEEEAWEAFLHLVWQYPEAPIYHFCPYEAQTVQRLANQYNTPSHLVEPLLRRFIDLHYCVTNSVILPVESYALKHIARWVGFDWRDAEANGAQSICWYADWLTTGDRAFLEAILRYNEDDCRATYHLKDWLVEFAQPFWQQKFGSGQYRKAQ